ncbi:hypothetical protein AeRB84_015113 [Aphanomyces euteiches]|nr:hypothetical protein AeRB84_015113 [Aphanomyces euteiches]
MACHLITATNIDEDYHFQAASANVVNRILARARTNCNKVIEKFQSHSSRRGSASEAMSHTGVSVPGVIARGGWSFDSLNRAFLYFSGMDRGDMRVGRVLAGWADSDHGGGPVMFDAIPTNEQPMFQSLTRHLFRHVLAKYDEHLLLALSSSLISYYNIVESEWAKRDSSASCFIHNVVRRSLNTVGGNDFILSKWSSILRESWLISNLLWLGHDQISGLTTDIKDKATVSALTLEKKLDLLAAGQHESAKQLARLVNIVAEQQAQVVALTHTVKQLSDATSALEKTLTIFAHTRSNEPTNAYQSIQPKAPVINSGVVSVPFSTAHVVPIPKSLKNMRPRLFSLNSTPTVGTHCHYRRMRKKLCVRSAWSWAE